MGLPWIEKYRPKSINNIVGDKHTQAVLEGIVSQRCLPHLMISGPPGTGKTTTVLGLNRVFCDGDKSACLYLNASDERGVGVIRSRIENFSKSDGLFGKRLKLVILDEADSMTENAQNALTAIIPNYQKNVRFCLVCNYSNMIIKRLSVLFLPLRFRLPPRPALLSFLRAIARTEDIEIADDALDTIVGAGQTDIRSMINDLQAYPWTKGSYIVTRQSLREIVHRIEKGKYTDLDECYKAYNRSLCIRDFTLALLDFVFESYPSKNRRLLCAMGEFISSCSYDSFLVVRTWVVSRIREFLQ